MYNSCIQFLFYFLKGWVNFSRSGGPTTSQCLTFWQISAKTQSNKIPYKQTRLTLEINLNARQQKIIDKLIFSIGGIQKYGFGELRDQIDNTQEDGGKIFDHLEFQFFKRTQIIYLKEVIDRDPCPGVPVNIFLLTGTL